MRYCIFESDPHPRKSVEPGAWLPDICGVGWHARYGRWLTATPPAPQRSWAALPRSQNVLGHRLLGVPL